MSIKFDKEVYPLILHKKIKEIQKEIEKIVQEKTNKIELDFSNTRYFFSGSLIFLINIIDYLKSHKNLDVKILLPTGEPGEEQVKAKKARDFLWRWKFFDTLEHYFSSLEELLGYEQYYRYLINEDPKYYLRSYYEDEKGNLLELYSCNVIEISYFTERIQNKNTITSIQIQRSLTDYTQERILHIIAKNIKWNVSNGWQLANQFVTKCIREPLINALDHASNDELKASIGLITAHIDNKYFIISIVDNGLGIPTTIKPVYEYYKSKINGESDVKLIEYAFEPPNEEEVKRQFEIVEEKGDTGLIELSAIRGITSKPTTHKGMGLAYLKEFVGRMKGFVDVHSGYGYVRFQFDPSANRVISVKREILPFMQGTFLSIHLPHKLEKSQWKKLR